MGEEDGVDRDGETDPGQSIQDRVIVLGLPEHVEHDGEAGEMVTVADGAVAGALLEGETTASSRPGQLLFRPPTTLPG